MSHLTCAYLRGVRKDDLNKLAWICDDCIHWSKNVKSIKKEFEEMQKRFWCEFSVANEKLHNVLEVIDKGISDVKNTVEELTEGSRAESAVSSPVCTESRSWTEVVKNKEGNR